jgi:hypothetical protein
MTSGPVVFVARHRPTPFLLCAVLLAVLATWLDPARAGVPDVSYCYYVPQAGSVTAPLEGNSALIFFRTCPNNDGGTSLPNNARIKVVLQDVNGWPIADFPAEDIGILFNGGPVAQGFVGVGCDSIVANSLWNQDPLCPDVRFITADAPTDANGVTYITFQGSTPGSPGVATRDPNRKWGHYDSEIPVFVWGFRIMGRLTTASAPGSYALRIKNFDFLEGLGPDLNEGEAVTATEFNALFWHIGRSSPISYWLDFDSNGIINLIDFNILLVHLNHDCDTPNSP